MRQRCIKIESWHPSFNRGSTHSKDRLQITKWVDQLIIYSSFVPSLPFCTLVVSLQRSRAVSFQSDKILLQGKGSSCASFIAFTCATHCEQVTESLSFSQTLGAVLFYQLPKCNIYTLDALLKVFHKYIHPSQFILNQLEPKWKNSVHISGNCWSGKAILKFLFWICACYDNSGFCFDKPKHPTVHNVPVVN